MYPTWPMVFAALIAGVLAGFIVVPDKQQQSSAAVPKEAAAPAPKNNGEKNSGGMLTAANVSKDGGVREVPLTRAGTPPEAKPLESEIAAKAPAPDSCAAQSWPYRTPGCLDRTAAVASPSTVVKAKRVDPAVGLSAEPSQQQADRNESGRKVVTAKPVRPEKPQTVSASGNDPDEEERPAAAAPVRRDDQSRQAVRRLRDVEFNDGIPTRVYLRGPDGRLYLAPEYRPSAGPRYYVR